MKTDQLATEETVETISALREFVNQQLCYQNDFELNVFPLSERVLFQGGKPCGIFFCVHGPRNVQLNAIWEAGKNTILFYGSGGEKVDKFVLANTLDFDDYEFESTT